MTLTRKDRALGMLLGLHAGDCLGATLEFEKAREPEHWLREIVGGGAFNWRPGQATDDTDLMICVLNAVNEAGFSFETLKENLLHWFDSYPPDIGITTRRGLTMLRRGIPLEECGDDSESSQGNGSLMRCAPLALLECNEGELEKIVSLQSRITHAHPRCLLADWVLISSLRLLLDGAKSDDAYLHALTITKKRDEPFYQSLVEIRSTPWENLNTSGYVVDTLVAGFWGLLSCSNTEEALISVVNRGQDADTCGAIAGALCGAHRGWQSIPSLWLEKLEKRRWIEERVGEIL